MVVFASMLRLSTTCTRIKCAKTESHLRPEPVTGDPAPSRVI